MRQSAYPLRKRGFTIVELIIVILLLGILSAYVGAKQYSVGDETLRSQAEKMRRDLRHAQRLAMAWGKTLTVGVTTGANGGYSVSCTAVGSAPCDQTDPVTSAVAPVI